jgi:hypothetical protein
MPAIPAIDAGSKLDVLLSVAPLAPLPNKLPNPVKIDIAEFRLYLSRHHEIGDLAAAHRKTAQRSFFSNPHPAHEAPNAPVSRQNRTRYPLVAHLENLREAELYGGIGRFLAPSPIREKTMPDARDPVDGLEAEPAA